MKEIAVNTMILKEVFPKEVSTLDTEIAQLEMLMKKSRYLQALSGFNEILENQHLISVHDRHHYVSHIHLDIGCCYYYLGEHGNHPDLFFKSIDSIQKSLKLQNMQQTTHDKCFCYFILGSSYFYLSEICKNNAQYLKSAVTAFEDALEISDDLSISDRDSLYYRLGISYKNIADFYNPISNLQKALEVLFQLYTYQELQDNVKFTLYSTQVQIASVYIRIAEMEQDDGLANDSLELLYDVENFYLNEIIKIPFGKNPIKNSVINLNLGECYQEISRLIDKHIYLKKAETCYINASRTFSNSLHPSLNTCIVSLLRTIYEDDQYFVGS